MAVPRQDTVTLELPSGLRHKLLCGGHQTVAALAGCRPQDLQAGASARPFLTPWIPKPLGPSSKVTRQARPLPKPWSPQTLRTCTQRPPVERGLTALLNVKLLDAFCWHYTIDHAEKCKTLRLASKALGTGFFFGICTERRPSYHCVIVRAGDRWGT